MAQYKAVTDQFTASRTVQVIGSDSIDNYTVYSIVVCLGKFKWVVKHRYSEFHELHEKLVSNFKLEKGLLPPKKIFGNQSEAFIKKRQKDLELYLQAVLQRFNKLPTHLAKFLDFNTYEIHGLTQQLAEDLFNQGDAILEKEGTFCINPLLLHSVNARLKLAEPTCDTGNAKQDIGHILDFLTRLRFLKIKGSNDRVGTSDIQMNQLPFDMNNFKSLESLYLSQCNAANISGLEHLKKTLKTLTVHKTIENLKDILMIDIGFGQWINTDTESMLVPAWCQLTHADFSHNTIKSIDESVKLIPKLIFLCLAHNKLQDVQNLQHLSALCSVDLSHNNFKVLTDFHTKFGNIKRLRLAYNHIDSLQGLSKLYSLENLDVSHNEITKIEEIKHLSGLPCLENLNLKSNPLGIIVDYRSRVLECFKDRAKEVCLDGQKPNQRELDKVAILVALTKSREASEKHAIRKPAREAEIADSPRAPVDELQVYSPSSSASDTQTTTSDLTPTRAPMRPRREEVQRSRYNYGETSVAIDSAMLTRKHDDDGSNSSSSSSTISDNVPNFMLPETMPSRNDTNFMSHLQQLTPDTHALKHKSGLGNDQREERPVHAMWTSAVCYTNPSREIPACIFITTENIHIFRVESLRGRDGFPDLEHIYCVPLMNVQQVVLGHEKLSIRIEEAFVGPQGTISFLTGSSHKTDLFLDSLKLAYRRAIPDLDQYEDPHVITNEGAEMNLKSTANEIEKLSNVTDVNVHLYSLVHSRDYREVTSPYKTYTLVITSSCMYLLQEDYILWPQPTFSIGPSARPQFEIIQSFPILGRIIGIQMYDSDTYSPSEEASLTQTFSATNSSSMVVPNFIGYGVRLTFDIGGGNGPQDFDVRFSTSGMRDRFLATFTKIRKECSDRSPSPPKFRSSKHRRDSDTDTASTSSAGSLPIIHTRKKSAKHKGKKTKVTSQSGIATPIAVTKKPSSSSLNREMAVGSIETPQDGTISTTQQDSKTQNDKISSVSSDRVYTVKDILTRDSSLGSLGRDPSLGSLSETENVQTAKDESNSNPQESNVNPFGEELSSKDNTEQRSDNKNEVVVDQTCDTVKEMNNEKSNKQFSDALLETFNSGERQELSKDSSKDDDEYFDYSIPRQSPTGSSNNSSSPEASPMVIPKVVLPSDLGLRSLGPPSSRNVPNSLDVSYPTMKLLSHLGQCNNSVSLLRPMSTQMQNLAAMNGEELINLFHSNIAQISMDTNEELRHIMWVQTVPYVNPKQEITTCVMLSTKALYFLSDESPVLIKETMSAFHKTHSRNKSDSLTYVMRYMQKLDIHNASGIISKLSRQGQKIVHPYYVMPLKTLRNVDLGLFDQSLRFVGSTPESVLACVTRDSTVTECFVKQLMNCLSFVNPTPSPELDGSGSTADFYSMFADASSRAENTEFVHPSKVKFIYPGDETVNELTYVLQDSVKGKTFDSINFSILMYCMCYKVSMIAGQVNYSGASPCSLAVLRKHIGLIIEDVVSYPIPEFARAPPPFKRFQVHELRSLENLKKVVVSDFTSHDLTLVFADVSDEIVVDTRIAHFSESSPEITSHTPEVEWVLSVQSAKDKSRLINSIKRQWEEVHTGEDLMVQVVTA